MATRAVRRNLPPLRGSKLPARASHGSRHGLHSPAAPRLGIAGCHRDGCSRRDAPPRHVASPRPPSSPCRTCPAQFPASAARSRQNRTNRQIRRPTPPARRIIHRRNPPRSSPECPHETPIAPHTRPAGITSMPPAPPKMRSSRNRPTRPETLETLYYRKVRKSNTPTRCAPSPARNPIHTAARRGHPRRSTDRGAQPRGPTAGTAASKPRRPRCPTTSSCRRPSARRRPRRACTRASPA